MNKELLLVSVCCLSYNHRPYIKDCLEGFVKQQCNFQFEVLIHDDASSDGTSDIIREYQKKYPNIIKPIIQTENQYQKGVAVNRVYNFPRAQGKYIALCEGDDYWTDPLKLQKQVDYMEAHPSVVLTFHDRDIINYEGKLIKSSTLDEDVPLKVIDSKKVISYFIPTMSMVFRRESIKDLPRTNMVAGDLLVQAHLSTKGDFVHLFFNGAVYRQHLGGVFSKLDVLQKREMIYDAHLKILEEVPNLNKKAVYYALILICMVSFKMSIQKLNLRMSFTYFFRTLFHFYNFIIVKNKK